MQKSANMPDATQEARQACNHAVEGVENEQSIVNLFEAGQISENPLPCLRHLIQNESAGDQRKDQRPDANSSLRHDHAEIFQSVIQQLVRLLTRAVCEKMQKRIVSERLAHTVLQQDIPHWALLCPRRDCGAFLLQIG